MSGASAFTSGTHQGENHHQIPKDNLQTSRGTLSEYLQIAWRGGCRSYSPNIASHSKLSRKSSSAKLQMR